MLSVFLLLLLVVVIESLIVWGIGNLVILAFGLKITFTFIQAVAMSLVLEIIKSIFK
jgi:hypothetical protein